MVGGLRGSVLAQNTAMQYVLRKSRRAVLLVEFPDQVHILAIL